jgi:hypothetical protein
MDMLSGAVPVFGFALLGATLFFGISALLQFRRARRERLQMKKHLRQIGVVS